jgi:hypothetical protein
MEFEGTDTKTADKVYHQAMIVIHEWREWHKDSNQLISDELITELNKLDDMFPGPKAGSED